MDKEASGPYSYQGAANEFKAICGFMLPDWIEPMEGHYYITKHGKNFVSQARLQFKTDPSRIAELRAMVLRAYQERWPANAPMVPELSQPDPAGPEYWGTYYRIIENGFYRYKVSIGVNSDGSISLSNTRGPEDWDR
jgi:hypothetical protein